MNQVTEASTLLPRAIRAGEVILPTGTLLDGVVEIADGRIAWAGRYRDYSPEQDVPLLDATHLILAPGFIDLHTHGGGGYDPVAGDASALPEMSRFYAQHGVTGFLASAWGKHDQILHAIDLAVEAMRTAPLPGATLLGIFLEGPFLSPDYPGAFQPESIVPPDPDLFAHYLARAQGLIRLMTLAPERPRAGEVIRAALTQGVIVAAGHTGATADEIAHAAVLGVRHATHMFNAMSPLHHRAPNAVGAILADPHYTAEIICDGIHVHPTVVQILVQTKGAERVALITDSIRAAGLPGGQYSMADGDITVSNGSVRLADGTLAGSILTMDRAVANMIAFAGVSLADAVAMASTTPARILGIADRTGAIAAGLAADLILLDGDLRVVQTVAGGRVVYTVDEPV